MAKYADSWKPRKGITDIGRADIISDPNQTLPD